MDDEGHRKNFLEQVACELYSHKYHSSIMCKWVNGQVHEEQWSLLLKDKGNKKDKEGSQG